MNYERSGSSGVLETIRTNSPTLTDVALILGLLSVADVLLFQLDLGQPLRGVIGLPILVFLPGYALVAALFPRRAVSGDTHASRHRFQDVAEGAIDWVERVTLSFGMSVALLPLLGIALSLTGFGYSTSTILGTLNAVIFVGLLVGVFRRYKVPESERFTVSLSRGTSTAAESLFGGSTLETTLSIAVVGMILVASGALGFALMAPGDGESYTTMSLVTENETGEYVTAGYPSDLATGESGSLVVGVTNHEDREVSYTLVAELQRVERADGDVTVESEQRLDRETQTVADNETWYSDQVVRANSAGEYRVVYLLYRDDEPAEPSIDNAYRYGHIWVTVG
ncbi:DUF1616 domain-containing protein [Haloarculaceae archaeon H-GB1-1]|nr:DUF1616 domain-containing protein [Haloarculaceae archaeon H-GB1-1]